MIFPQTPVEWVTSGSWLIFNGLKIFVTTHGAGEPILVLHGFPTASYDFARVVPLLAHNYRLILFDYPGFGFSDKPNSRIYSLFRYADAAQAVVDYFGLKQSLILAHDIGVSVALEILRRNVLTVRKLTLLNSSILSIPFDDYRMLLIQKLLLHPISGPFIIKLRFFCKPLFAAMFQKVFFKRLQDEEIAAFWSLIRYNKGHTIYHLLIRYMHERWQYQHVWLDETLAKHKAPLTLIWGQADPVAPPVIADWVLKRRPDAAYIKLDHVGHYPHWEAPAAVASSVCKVFE
jgi:pimeloyl-ACP methyl ester carboxylesterase